MNEEQALFVDKLGLGNDWTATEIMNDKGYVIGYWVDTDAKAHNERSKAIAALPELLAASKNLLDFWRTMVELGHVQWVQDNAPIAEAKFEDMEEAIAKATQ